MSRMPQGTLVWKLIAAILASTLLLPPSAGFAADNPLPDSSGTTVKTISPLTDEQGTVDLEFTSAASEAPAGSAITPVMAQQIDDTAPVSIPASAPTPPPQPEPTLVPQAVQAPAALPDNSVQVTNLDNAPAPVPAPAAPTSPKRDNKTQSTDYAIAPAPPEVTAPQRLNPSSPSGRQSDQRGELAQNTPTRPRSPQDPVYTKLPTTSGTVKIKRGFDRFPTNQIIHSLSFRDTPVKEVIGELGSRGNLNIIIDKSVQSHITGNLHDITLNEAMDTVLTGAGLQWRQMENSTVIIGAAGALTSLGLNRPIMRAFKVSYASPFEVANLLWASVFNKGLLPDFTQAIRSRTVNVSKEAPSSKTAEEISRGGSAPAPGGGTQTSKSVTTATNQQEGNEENESGEEINQSVKPDATRTLRGTIRIATNEGTGFNSGATDPGSQTIRSSVPVTTDLPIDQNGGGAIVIPDVKNSQVLVCGTQEDIDIAEEAIHILDRRPRQVHIQSSLIEITNSGVRQLGAALNLQGAGASGTVLGGSGAPLVNFLPGLGSQGQTLTQTFNNGAGISGSSTNAIAGLAALPLAFSQTIGGITSTIAQHSLSGTGNLANVPAPGFGGILGAALPITLPTLAGIAAAPTSASAFNFLTLNKRAGGAANIATMPLGLNLNLNLVLQSNKAKELANPSVIVSDNTETLITLADEVVHKVTTTVSLGVVSTNVELVKAGIFLDVLPRISEDGFITMRLRPQVSEPLSGPQEFANNSVVVTLLSVRDIMTQEVRVKDGQTLVIGGLFSEQEAASLSKVPYLAEAPILGALFRNSTKGRQRHELMLLITPKIVEEQPADGILEGNTSPTL